MFTPNPEPTQSPDGKKLSVALVQARFNPAVTDALAESCKAELLRLGVKADHIRLVKVPGALEIGVALQALAESSDYDALIAIGCIIRGETYHFELVANESGAAVTRLALDYRTPVINAILTCENTAQAEARQLVNGRAAAAAAVEMALLINSLS